MTQGKHDMEFVARITKMGEYFYIRIPKERNESAKRYFKNKGYLVVNCSEIETY